MTDRVDSATVVFDKDIRDDDIQPLLLALGLMKHVIAVKPHIVDIHQFVADERANKRWSDKLVELLKEQWNERTK
jgi:hypothetical protein